MSDADVKMPEPDPALKDVALLLNRLILMSSAKAQQEPGEPPQDRITDADIDGLEADVLEAVRAAVLADRERWQHSKLWLWQNFVDGRREYWAFDNPYPVHMGFDDPQTLGEPCGYALFKPSRNGRPDVPESKVLAAIQRVWGAAAIRKGTP